MAGRSRLGDIVALFFEEPEVARLITIGESAAGFTVPDPATGFSDRHIIGIQAPGVIGGSRCVLFFRTAHTGKPRFSVRLNTTQLIQHTFSVAGLHSWHEIAPGGALKPENNELVFAVSGDGTVTFSDAVIIYRSNQLTVRKELVVSLSQA